MADGFLRIQLPVIMRKNSNYRGYDLSLPGMEPFSRLFLLQLRKGFRIVIFW